MKERNREKIQRNIDQLLEIICLVTGGAIQAQVNCMKTQEGRGKRRRTIRRRRKRRRKRKRKRKRKKIKIKIN